MQRVAIKNGLPGQEDFLFHRLEVIPPYVVLGMDPGSRHILLSPVLGFRIHVDASGDWKMSEEVWDRSRLQ